MLTKIVLATVAAVVAYLICVFVGGVLFVSLGVPIAVAIGQFLEQYASVIAVLVWLWHFFSGGTFSFGRQS